MTEILVSDFVTVLLILVRIAACFYTAPFFNNSALSATAKLFFALVIAYLLFFTVEPVDISLDTGMFMLAAYALKEAIVGILIGFSMHFIFYGIQFGGHIIGFEVGLTMALLFDPITGEQNNILTEILTLASILVFILIQGHHFLVQALAASLDLIPIGGFSASEPLYELLLTYSAGLFVVALKISAPFIVAFFLMNIAAGVISRMIPQMQIFFVMLPLKIGVGLAMLAVGAPMMFYVIRNLLEAYEESLLNIIKAMGS